jgi:peptidoglycan/LPS O-acetylase OafA/YrhL
MTAILKAEASAGTESGRYRPDIDGLRAVAVTAVVAYHAFPQWAPGGFVGVDVFFVISGFLITRIIASERDAGTFRFLDFYQRRARRILPAYFVMTAVVALVALAILLPAELRNFGAVLAASNLFLTNAVLAQTAVYFEPASRDWPLLHLWSLAVEEQFYAVWPLLILSLTLAPLRRLRPALMLGLATSSLVFAEWQIGRGATREAFYYLPGRAWEFLLGGLLGAGALAGPASRFAANTATLAGYGLIGAAIAFLNDQSNFPGVGALAPCLGAAALIWAGSGKSCAASALLRASPVVTLGRISYSLYLWHWPPLVFARLILVEPLPPQLSAALTVLALGLAALSWRFVEQPWRARQGRWAYVGLAALVAIGLTGLGAFEYLDKGLPARVPHELVLEDTDVNPMRQACFELWTPTAMPPASCVSGDPRAPGEALVWGDSHADAITPGVVAWAGAQGLRVREATRAGCPPLTGAFVLLDGRRSDPPCLAFDRNVLALAKDPGVKLLVLSARWPMYMNARPLMGGYDPPMQLVDDATGGSSDLARALDQTLTAIRASGINARVLIVGPIPELPFSPPDCMTQARRFGLPFGHCLTAPDADTLARTDPAIGVIDRVAKRHPGVGVVFPSHTLCAAGVCRTTESGDILYYDADHLSASGARRLAPAWLDSAFKPPR